MLKFVGWGLDSLKGEIHSFPTMNIMRRGVNRVEMGQNKDFLQKYAFKTAFLSSTILDHPTSDWAVTHNFKDIANFHRCFKKFGT